MSEVIGELVFIFGRLGAGEFDRLSVSHWALLAMLGLIAAMVGGCTAGLLGL